MPLHKNFEYTILIFKNISIIDREGVPSFVHLPFTIALSERSVCIFVTAFLYE